MPGSSMPSGSGGTQTGSAGGTASTGPQGQAGGEQSTGTGTAGDQQQPGGQGTGTDTAGGNDSWDKGLPGAGGNGDWQTSNQVPGDGSSRIPPMPTERDKPAGGGDGKLDGALGDLDGKILSERGVIRQRSNETAGGGGEGGQAAQDATKTAQSGGGGTADTPEPGGSVGGLPSNRTAPPAPNPVAAASVPEDIPDAHDDDIIARQLREAAMKETDPVLKKKLWDEYRKYKGI